MAKTENGKNQRAGSLKSFEQGKIQIQLQQIYFKC